MSKLRGHSRSGELDHKCKHGPHSCPGENSSALTINHSLNLILAILLSWRNLLHFDASDVARTAEGHIREG
jgi:hypothetical protein